MTVAVFLTAWFLHLIAAASPGPAILMAARIGVTEGRKTGVFLAVGIGLGALFWAVSALFGLALLFEIAPTVLWGFKLAGVLFLFWIALSMWRHADDPLVDPSRVTLPRSPWSALRLGILTQLSNPKPAVFFGAVFGAEDHPPAGLGRSDRPFACGHFLERVRLQSRRGPSLLARPDPPHLCDPQKMDRPQFWVHPRIDRRQDRRFLRSSHVPRTSPP